jgi:hypothetical protein
VRCHRGALRALAQTSKQVGATRLRRVDPACRGLENVLDPRLEEPRDPEGEPEAGVVLTPLECVDGLTGYFELLGEVSLRPLPLGSEVLQSVGHLFFAVAVRRFGCRTRGLQVRATKPGPSGSVLPREVRLRPALLPPKSYNRWVIG